MMVNLEKIVEDTAVELLRRAANVLHEDYAKALNDALKRTEGKMGKSQLENIVENVSLASKHSEPMCQDTGVVSFMVKLGDGFPLRSGVKEVLKRATRRATKEVPLRPNTVEFFRGNTGDNTGSHVPIIYVELTEGDQLELTAMPKGGGSSNVAAFGMLVPGLGLKGVKQFVIESVAKAGSLGCPPYFVGVGVGGGEDYCMYLAKRALLRPFRTRNPDPRIAELEEELLGKVNELGVGAMGMGEGPTALDLHIEMAARHPASMPAGIVMSCWAFRHAKASIANDGKVKIE